MALDFQPLCGFSWDHVDIQEGIAPSLAPALFSTWSAWRLINIPIWSSIWGYSPRKQTWQWNIHHLKMYFLLNMGIFQCHGSFQGCYVPDIFWRTFQPLTPWSLSVATSSLVRWGCAQLGECHGEDFQRYNICFEMDFQIINPGWWKDAAIWGIPRKIERWDDPDPQNKELIDPGRNICILYIYIYIFIYIQYNSIIYIYTYLYIQYNSIIYIS